MPEGKISIIVPIYNSEKDLEQCIESIVNQTYNNLEIILVNDGSKDNSVNICKKWESNDSRIILIDKQNEGVAKLSPETRIVLTHEKSSKIINKFKINKYFN